MLLISALAADSIESEFVIRHLKVMFLGNPALQLFYAGVVEFGNPAARGTDKMIMVLLLMHRFITHLFPLETFCRGDIAFGQKAQRPVNR